MPELIDSSDMIIIIIIIHLFNIWGVITSVLMVVVAVNLFVDG